MGTMSSAKSTKPMEQGKHLRLAEISEFHWSDLLHRNMSAQQDLKWLLHRNGSVQRKGVKSMGNTGLPKNHTIRGLSSVKKNNK